MKKGIDKMNKIRTSYVWADPRKCAACWKCIETCPKQVIGKVKFLWHKHIILVNSSDCIGCKKCINTCPHGVFRYILGEI
ncbi:MAG: 4Fe-4S binding protein [Odoribacter sp.]|nr:4Fe-4S binding protein [Odoribacter sp.]